MAAWTNQHEDRYRSLQREQVRHNYLMLVRLGLLIVPLFAISDWFAYRENFSELLVIRVSIFLVFLAFDLMGRVGYLPGGPVRSGMALMLSSAVAITTMCWVTGGPESSYYAGINLLTLAVVIVFSGNFRYAWRSIAIMNGIYVGAMIAHSGLLPSETETFTNNVIFLVATTCMALVSVRLSERLHRKSFLQMLESEEAARLRASRDAAQNALELRQEFIAIASHELNTPLTSMKLQNDLLRQRMSSNASPTPGEVRAWADRNERALRRLMRLVDDMLDISRITSGRMTLKAGNVDLGRLVHDICESHRSQLEAAGIELQIERKGQPRGYWDTVRIEQVVTNLISNAIKYAPRSPLDIAVRDEGPKAIIEVRDHGPGVTAENQRRIFDRFERATPYRKVAGLGLGLYISRCIVESHGGSIRVTSGEAGKGACFIVELPLEKRSFPVELVELEPAEPTVGRLALS